MITARFDPAELADAWSAALAHLTEVDAVRRLWDGDHTVIQEDPTECADRLGWLHAPRDSARSWPRWALVADEVADGAGDQEAGRFTDVLVLGMGGSSLFPEVLSRTFEPGDGFPRISVLDTTDPDAIARVAAACDPEHTIVVVASKSGSTIETRSHLEWFWARSPIGRQFIAITDPGSGLEALANERGFRAVLHGDPEIGGRFSALSAFGMVPAALMGMDATLLLDTAEEALDVLGPDTPVDEHLGAQLGALMAVAAAAGRDKLTFHLDPRIVSLGSWLEQLIAESTGKHGVGILPVLDEPVGAPDAAGRLHVVIGDADVDLDALDGPWVHLQVEEPQDLGAQIVLWEFATTFAGIVAGINPFDQPDVESAKREARGMLEGAAASPATSTLDEALALVRPGDALIIGAFVDPQLEPRLQAARRELGRRAGVATTLGLGPRFLHSTGQLHKGGADRHVVVQVLGTPATDLAIPGESFTFGELIRAQADGDLAALRASGHRAVRVELDDLLALAD